MNRTSTIVAAALMTVAYVAAVGAQDQEGGALQFSAHAVIARDRVVASDFLAGDFPPALQLALQRIELGYTPLPGYTKTITRDAFVRAVAKCEIPGIESWSLPAEFRVERRSRVLTEDEIRAAATAFVAAMSTPTVRVAAESVSCPRAIHVPDAAVRLELSAPRRTLLGRRLDLEMSIYSESRLYRKQWVQAIISYTASVPVASKDIAPFTQVAAADFTIVERKLDSIVDKLLDPKFNPAGMVARRLVRAGDVISPLYLTPPVLVRQGDRVRITIRSDSFQIATEGVARTAGRLGDTVTVINTETRRIFAGRVTGEKEVEVLS